MGKKYAFLSCLWVSWKLVVDHLMLDLVDIGRLTPQSHGSWHLEENDSKIAILWYPASARKWQSLQQSFSGLSWLFCPRRELSHPRTAPLSWKPSLPSSSAMYFWVFLWSTPSCAMPSVSSPYSEGATNMLYDTLMTLSISTGAQHWR